MVVAARCSDCSITAGPTVLAGVNLVGWLLMIPPGREQERVILIH
jgi:hypothetical protein